MIEVPWPFSLFPLANDSWFEHGHIAIALLLFTERMKHYGGEHNFHMDRQAPTVDLGIPIAQRFMEN